MQSIFRGNHAPFRPFPTLNLFQEDFLKLIIEGDKAIVVEFLDFPIHILTLDLDFKSLACPVLYTKQASF